MRHALTAYTDYDRVRLLISTMEKARELDDLVLQSEEACLELELTIESTPVMIGRPQRKVIVTALPSRRLPI